MSEKGRLMKLEALRGFTALYVAIGHTFFNKLKFGNLDLNFLFVFGQEAVIVFFFLSGFVIKVSYERAKDKSFKNYFARRFLRIYIPLILFFLINYIIECIEINALVHVNAFNLLGNLFMLQDAYSLKPRVVCETFLGNAPLWSLSYEWWFYMLFFGAMRFFKKNASTVVYITAICAAVSYFFYPFFANRFLMYFVLWWMGVEMAAMYLAKEIYWRKLMPAIAVLATINFILILNAFVNKEKVFALLQVKGFGISPLLEVRHFLFALAAVFAAFVWHKLHWRFFNLAFGLFTPLAGISFGLYISHYFLVSKASYLGFVQNVYFRYILYALICLGVSYLVERIIYPYINRLVMNLPFFTNRNLQNSSTHAGLNYSHTGKERRKKSAEMSAGYR